MIIMSNNKIIKGNLKAFYKGVRKDHYMNERGMPYEQDKSR